MIPANKRLHLVIILDEIEYLCPPGAELGVMTSTSALVPQFFGVLRKLVQESTVTNHNGARVSLVLAGLASASVEARQLYGRENPLFGFAKPYYVSPFGLDDTAELLRVLGARHGLTWDDDAIELVQFESGGHAILVRELASQVSKQIPAQGLEMTAVSKALVEQALARYRRAVASQIDQILSHIQRFYETEWQLLELLMTGGRDDFASFAELYPSAVNRLENLGIIKHDGEEWRSSKLLAIGWRNGLDVLQVARGDALASKAILERIKGGESKHLEFKSTFAVPVSGRGSASDVRDSFLKVVISFFNSGGGTIFVGVSDEGQILGIELDIKAAGGTTDKLTLQVQAALNSAVGRVHASTVSISFPRVDNERVLQCAVPASREPVWPERTVAGKSDVLFVRQNANTQSLAGNDIVEYLKANFRFDD